MKKILTLLFLVSLSSCFITEPTGYIDYRQRRMYDWDPIYYTPGYIDPFFYRREPPIIIYRHRYVPVPRQPQQPRRNAFGPTAPPSAPRSPRSAPIREFSKKDDKKNK
jgi:hypothetical protein